MTSPEDPLPQQDIKINVKPALGGGSLWQPVEGEELNRLLAGSPLEEEARAAVATQSLDILGRGVDPNRKGQQRRTGLVVGYVQSGKTLSFTAAMAGAHDNEVPLVVLLTGTKKNLHQQTYDRLKHDLNLERSGDVPWLLLSNPSDSTATVESIRATLARWLQPTGVDLDNRFLKGVRNVKRTVIITVMKNKTQLGKTRDIIVSLKARGVDFAGLPVLVVDDEADQAGLNARPADEDEPTATYRAIRDLRDEIPRHTYLEYTATPQAPLLLNLLDNLSPDFAVVLDPGAGYKGGKHFFDHQRETFVRVIPQGQADQAAKDDAAGPPESLLTSLATYLVTSLLMSNRGVRHSSMLVHPSHTKDLHKRYANWVSTVVDGWREALGSDPDMRQQIIDEYLRSAHEDLEPGQGLDPDAAGELADAVLHVLKNLQVRVVNSGTSKDEEIDWNAHDYWVLVGGNKLDRGYTIEGLATTFMPRGTGGGQADTIQQRARFFGYKDDYDDLCRAWLTPGAVDIYDRYVDHEEALRAALQKAAQDGEDLKQWRRKMILDPKLKPCRRNVISLAHVRDRVKGGSWTQWSRLPQIDAAAHAENNALMRRFVQRWGAERSVDGRDPRAGTRTTVFAVPLRAVVDELLDNWQLDESGRSVRNALTLLLGARLDDDPDLRADVYLPTDLAPRDRAHNGIAVANLHQGPDPSGSGFPGDAAFRTDDDSTVSVQLFDVTLKSLAGEPARPGCPGLAYWVPKGLAADVIQGVQ